MNSRPPRRILRSFEDFLSYHSNQSPIYFSRNRLFAGYNMSLDIALRYRLEEPLTREYLEKYIAENLRLFVRYPMPYFFYPGSPDEKGLPGEILFVKKGRKNNDSLSRAQVQND